MIYQNEADLLAEATRLIAKWQPLLLLQEWEINCKTGELTDSKAEFECAKSSFFAKTRQAVIVFDLPFWTGKRTPSEESKPERQGLDSTVVHELLHIRTADWRAEYEYIIDDVGKMKSQNFYHEEEKFINILARILVNLEAKR